jgi:alginate O-acetyltransferase complex protein AlgI
MLSIERLMGKRALYYHLPRGFQVIATFLLILVTWVFFRAKNMQHALAYLKDMFAFGDARPSVALMDGILYTPYFLGTFVVAAVVSWSFPIAWIWTERITPLKAVVVTGMLWLSVVVMVTQAYNPFIYFIF